MVSDAGAAEVELTGNVIFWTPPGMWPSGVEAVPGPVGLED